MAENISGARAATTIRIIWYWFPVIMMFGVMYYFSTDVFSAENTRTIIDKIFLWFSPHASKRSLTTFNYVVRKSAHFAEYAALGALLFRAFRDGNPVRWRLKWAVYSFLASAGWALLDELHQSFTRKRGATIWDSLLDSSGALLMLIGIAIITHKPWISLRRPVRGA